jgi:AraC-like DNA-binding protein
VHRSETGVIGGIAWTQLGPGTLVEQNRNIDLGRLKLEFLQHGVACKGEGVVEKNHTLVSLTSGAQAVTRWHGLEVGWQDVGTTRSGIDICSTAPDSVCTITFSDRDVTDEYRKTHFVPDFLDRIHSRPVLVRNHYVRQLRSYAHGICSAGSWLRCLPKATLESNLLWFLGAAVSDKCEMVEPSRPQSRKVVAVRQCQEYIESRMGDPVTLLELSEISGLRPRSLISAFEAVTGMSPMAYLRARRLGEVRRVLESVHFPRMRITDVAADWGFWHMGHFTAAYRAMYGETPSQTLLRTRGEKL